MTKSLQILSRIELARLEPKVSKKTGEIRFPSKAVNAGERMLSGEFPVMFKSQGQFITGILAGIQENGKVLVQTERGTARVWADLVFDLERNKRGELTTLWQKAAGYAMLQLTGKIEPEFIDIDA